MSQADPMSLDVGATITPSLYIGSYITAHNKEWLKETDINAIINLSCKLINTNLPILNIIMEDQSFPLSEVPKYAEKFALGVASIERYTALNRRVLVVCQAGINRSATLACFYLLCCGVPIEIARELIINANRRCRSLPALTNPSFMNMLTIYGGCSQAMNTRGIAMKKFLTRDQKSTTTVTEPVTVITVSSDLPPALPSIPGNVAAD
jgi:hypothetical protein